MKEAIVTPCYYLFGVVILHPASNVVRIMPSFQNYTSEIGKIRVTLGHDQIIKARQFQALHMFQMLKQQQYYQQVTGKVTGEGIGAGKMRIFPAPIPSLARTEKKKKKKLRRPLVCLKHRKKQYLSTNPIMIKSSFNRIFQND